MPVGQGTVPHELPSAGTGGEIVTLTQLVPSSPAPASVSSSPCCALSPAPTAWSAAAVSSERAARTSAAPPPSSFEGKVGGTTCPVTRVVRLEPCVLVDSSCHEYASATPLVMVTLKSPRRVARIPSVWYPVWFAVAPLKCGCGFSSSSPGAEGLGPGSASAFRSKTGSKVQSPMPHASSVAAPPSCPRPWAAAVPLSGMVRGQSRW